MPNITQAYLWDGDLDLAERELDVWTRESPQNKYLLWFRAQPPLFLWRPGLSEKICYFGARAPTEEPLMISLNGLPHALYQDSGAALDLFTRPASLLVRLGTRITRIIKSHVRTPATEAAWLRERKSW